MHCAAQIPQRGEMTAHFCAPVPGRSTAGWMRPGRLYAWDAVGHRPGISSRSWHAPGCPTCTELQISLGRPTAIKRLAADLGQRPCWGLGTTPAPDLKWHPGRPACWVANGPSRQRRPARLPRACRDTCCLPGGKQADRQPRWCSPIPLPAEEALIGRIGRRSRSAAWRRLWPAPNRHGFNRGDLAGNDTSSALSAIPTIPSPTLQSGTLVGTAHMDLLISWLSTGLLDSDVVARSCAGHAGV